MSPILDFDELVREHQAGLRAYVRALGTQDAWVDDLAQEVFLVAYRRLDDFDATADFGRWLRGIARHLVLNERRKAARQSRLLEHALVDALLVDAAAIDVAPLAAPEVLQALRECVNRLPARSRDVLQRRYTESANAHALATWLGSTATAVRQTLVRSRTAVRRCIALKLGEDWL